MSDCIPTSGPEMELFHRLSILREVSSLIASSSSPVIPALYSLRATRDANGEGGPSDRTPAPTPTLEVEPALEATPDIWAGPLAGTGERARGGCVGAPAVAAADEGDEGGVELADMAAGDETSSGGSRPVGEGGTDESAVAAAPPARGSTNLPFSLGFCPGSVGTRRVGWCRREGGEAAVL